MDRRILTLIPKVTLNSCQSIRIPTCIRIHSTKKVLLAYISLEFLSLMMKESITGQKLSMDQKKYPIWKINVREIFSFDV